MSDIKTLIENLCMDKELKQPKLHTAAGDGVVRTDENGVLVLLSDYEKLLRYTAILDRHEEVQYKQREAFEKLAKELKAETEAQAKRWAESEDLISHYKQQMDEVINDCQCSSLKAEVERLDTLCKQLGKQHSDISCENIMLRKAGDAMADWIDNVQHDDYGWPFSDAWNAAKKGKPTK